jgi:predicted RNase H-like nuclease (RuvC/YqgF family)
MFETYDLLQQLGGDPDIAGSQMAIAAAHEAIEDAAEERRAEQQRSAAEQRRETLLILDRQFGGAQEQIRHLQAGISDQTDKVTDLREQLAKAERALESSRSSLAWWSERLLLAQEGTQRSTPPNAIEQATMRAADELRRVREGKMIIERARRGLRQRSGVLAHRPDSMPTSYLEARSEPTGHVSFR